MEICFSHFVYGKIIQEGVDQSGFSVIAKTRDLLDFKYKEILPQISIGQVSTWDNFIEVFTLTQNVSNNFKVFSYAFKSKIIDPKRGYFPIQHCLFIKNDLPENLVEFAHQFAFVSENYDYAFSEVKEVEPLCLPLTSELDNYSWENFDTNKYAILRILDSLFFSDSIVVITTDTNPLSRLAIANGVWLLLPPTLRRRFSFHTSFFGPPEKIESHLKFTEPRVFDNSKHALIDLRYINKSLTVLSNLRTSYATYIAHMLNDLNFAPKDMAQHCAELITDEGGFTFAYAQRIGEALKDKIEIPNFLVRISHLSPDVELSDVFEFLQKPQIYTNIDRVKLVWEFLLRNKDRSLIDDFMISNFRFAQSVVLNENENLMTGWVNYLIVVRDLDSLSRYLNDSQFISSNINLVPIILSVFVQTDVNFSEERVAFLIDYGIQSSDLGGYIKTVFANGLGYGKRKYPVTFKLLESFADHQTETKPKSNFIEKVVEEIGTENLIRLSVLSLRTGNVDFIKPELFLLFSKSVLTSRFFSEVEKNIERIKNSNLTLENFGALSSATLMYASGLLQKIIPSEKLSGSLNNITKFSLGFVRVADSAQTPKAIYTRFISSPSNLSPFDQINLCTMLAKLTTKYEGGKYLMNQATQLFSYYVMDGPKWMEIGENLFDLYTEKYQDIGNVFMQSMVVAYLKALGKMNQENIYSAVTKLVSYSISAHLISDAIGTVMSNSLYSLQQKIDIWFFLTASFYMELDEFGAVGKYSLNQLLAPNYVAQLTEEQLVRIVYFAENDKSIKLQVKEELLKRTLKKSLVQFIDLIVSESENKTEVELNSLVASIGRIWHPQNSSEVRTMLSSLERERKNLALKLWDMIISTKNNIAFDLQFDLLNDKIAHLKEEINDVEKLALWLNHSQPNSEINKDTKLIRSLKELFSNKSSFYIALEHLETKINPNAKRGWFGKK